MAESPITQQYLGIRLTIQCADPNDPYFHPQDVYPLDKPDGIYFGRAAGNDIELPHHGVSGQHCRLRSTAQGYVLEDLGSRNATIVGHQQLAPQQSQLLRDGEVIHISNYNITFRIGLSAFAPSSEEEELDNTYNIGHGMVEHLLNDPEVHTPSLKVLNGPDTGKTYELKEYEDFIIGRGRECQLTLPDDAISREHAQLRRDWTGVTIRDLNSRNGILVKGVRIQRNYELSLQHGDRITLGHHEFVFLDPFAEDMSKKFEGLWDENAVDEGLTLPPQALKQRKSRQEEEEPSSGIWRAPQRDAQNAPQTPKPQQVPTTAEPSSPPTQAPAAHTAQAPAQPKVVQPNRAKVKASARKKPGLRPYHWFLLFLSFVLITTLVGIAVVIFVV